MKSATRSYIVAAALAIAFAGCAKKEPARTIVEPPASAPIVDVPAGAYTLDKMHASLIFRVDHLGFSNYTARFKKFDAHLQFDPKNLEAATVHAVIDARSLETDFPDPAKVDFNAQLQNDQWLDTAKYPEMTYQTTKVDVVGPNTVKITGNLTLRGVTKPVTLSATFNGGYTGHPMDPNARIGFSATGELLRSDFGIVYGIPEVGTTMGVSDRVEVIIEAEFSGPPIAAASPSAIESTEKK